MNMRNGCRSKFSDKMQKMLKKEQQLQKEWQNKRWKMKIFGGTESKWHALSICK
jgi:hypothetical protein